MEVFRVLPNKKQTPSLPGFYVAIDTCIYISHQWNFDSLLFRTLSRLSRNSKIQVLRPAIVDAEVRRHLEKKISTNALKKGLLEVGLGPFQKDLNAVIARAQKENLDKFESFLRNLKSKPVGSKLADIEAIMNDYFNHRPPFGKSDGTQNPTPKHEFPDAVMVSSLKKFLANGATVIVLSADTMVLNCSVPEARFVVTSSLEELLSILGEEVDAVLSRWNLESESTGERLSESLPLVASINNSLSEVGSTLINWEDPDENVDYYEVTDVQILAVSVLSASIEEDLLALDLSIDFSASVDAELTLIDPNLSPWDSETGSYVSTYEMSARAQQTVDSTAFGTIRLTKKWELEIEELDLGISELEFDRNDAVVYWEED